MEFIFCEALNNRQIGKLTIIDWSFNNPVEGAGQFSGKISVRKKQVPKIKRMTKPDEVAVYAVENGVVLWGGPVVGRAWNSRTRQLTIQGAAWESWFYTRIMYFSLVRRQIDQMEIASDLLYVALDDSATPNIKEWPGPNPALAEPLEDLSSLSDSARAKRDLDMRRRRGYFVPTVKRDATYNRFRYVGEILDSLGSRDNGFDWAIDSRMDPQSKDIQPYFMLYYPERTSGAIMMLRSTPEGGNIISHNIPESSVNKRPRVWAVGAGQEPNRLAVSDQGPELGGFVTTLLRETVTSYSSVIEANTLFEHARAERVSRNAKLQETTIDVRPTSPNVTRYVAGDRARIVIRDEWDDIDVPAARIIDRSIKGSGPDIHSVTLTVDMNDKELPPTSDVIDDTPQTPAVTGGA